MIKNHFLFGPTDQKKKEPAITPTKGKKVSLMAWSHPALHHLKSIFSEDENCMVF